MSRHALFRFRRTPFRDHLAPQLSCIAYKIQAAVFDWDQNNLKKIWAHRIKVAAEEQALSREPVLIDRHDTETERNRLRAVVLTERDTKLRVITFPGVPRGRTVTS